MSEIESLEKEVNAKQDQLRKMRNRLDVMKLKRDMPGLRKKYEGRYFKYENGNGNGHWPIFSYCEKVIDGSMAKVHSFETSRNGKYEFTIGDTFFFLFQVEIRKSVYDKALKRFKANVVRLGKS